MVAATKDIRHKVKNHRNVFKTVIIMWSVLKKVEYKIAHIHSNINTIIALASLFPLKNSNKWRIHT